MPKASKKTHKMGEKCGYDVGGDGKIYPAPRYCDEFESISEEMEGVNALLGMITAHCAGITKRLRGRERALWREMMGDYGLAGKKCSYHHFDRCITVEPEGESDASE